MLPRSFAHPPVLRLGSVLSFRHTSRPADSGRMRTVFRFEKNAFNSLSQPRSVRALVSPAAVPATEWLRQHQRAAANG